MNPFWYVILGYILGQCSFVAAGYIGELLKERYDELR